MSVPVRRTYKALIVEPDQNGRVKLKQATTAADVFEKIDAANSPAEALAKLDSEPSDVIFISNRIEIVDQDQFIIAARKSKFGGSAAYITIEQEAQRTESTVASNLSRGVDGVLWEPYSVSSVVGTTKIADKIKAADASVRKQAAISMTISDALHEVDAIGRSRVENDLDAVRSSLQRLKKIGTELKTLSHEATSVYVEAFRQKLAVATAQKLELLKQRYGGVSARVQKLLDKKKQTKDTPTAALTNPPKEP